MICHLYQPSQFTCNPQRDSDLGPMRDDSLIALGNEIVGCVVGLMPAEEFLELLPPTSKPLPVEEKPFTNLADKKAESHMYDPFVRIPFIFFSYP